MTHDKPLLHPLLHAAGLVEDRLRKRLAPLGIRPRQARVLNALHKMGEASQIELARAFDITAASMSTMTDRLIAADFVLRRVDPDERRVHLLRLSPRGVEMIGQIQAAWADIDAMIIDAVGEERARALTGHALTLRDALGGEPPVVRLRRQADRGQS